MLATLLSLLGVGKNRLVLGTGSQKPSVVGKGGFGGGVSLALGPVSGLHPRNDLDSDGVCQKPCHLWTPALSGGEEPPASLHRAYAPGMPNLGFLVSR